MIFQEQILLLSVSFLSQETKQQGIKKAETETQYQTWKNFLVNKVARNQKNTVMLKPKGKSWERKAHLDTLEDKAQAARQD